MIMAKAMCLWGSYFVAISLGKGVAEFSVLLEMQVVVGIKGLCEG